MALLHTIFPSPPRRFASFDLVCWLSFEGVMTHTGKLAIFNQSDEGGISYTRRYSSIQDQPCPLSCSSVSFYLYRRRRSFRIDTTTSVVPSLRRQQQTRRWYTAAGGSLDGAIMRCNCGHGSRTT